MDVSELAEELRSDDPDLPPAEAAFVEAVEAARAALDTGELTSEEYHRRVANASDRYRRAANADG